jgi:CheY-like chemotaxis protein
MVFGMVQRHSARIEIDSALGKGTTIRITFPIAPGLAIDVRSRAPARDENRPLRLLLIDDDPVLLKALEATLAVDGHITKVAPGGEPGIEEFKRSLTTQRFDAVITDLGMPKVDGRQVAARVKELSRDTPVIMLTGWGRRLIAEHDSPDHVDLILSKPPMLNDLRSALATLCGARPAGGQ